MTAPTLGPDQLNVPSEVGTAFVVCGECQAAVPIAVHAWLTLDEDGDLEVWTEPSLFELEAHALTHGVGSAEPPSLSSPGQVPDDN
jgi:hypothetical protein